MVVSEKINQKVVQLPVARQLEVLDFVDFIVNQVDKERSANENADWSEFSLGHAMRGMEDEEVPEYTEADLIETWQ
jgi:hypothetical protein